ncbi:hypothetical protein [Vibrio atlanticus]|uniref:hypothetical protein n=1 Tax=Vibrio atlanticus TaxID=693153 RepID=UPI0035534941
MRKSTKEKLLDAFKEMQENGEKITASALEKKAKVSNGMVGYHQDIYDKVQNAKSAMRREPDDKMGVDSKTKEKLAATRKRLKEANALKSKYFNELKSLESMQQEHADQIANLTWALHKESSSEVLSEHLVKLKK